LPVADDSWCKSHVEEQSQQLKKVSRAVASLAKRAVPQDQMDGIIERWNSQFQQQQAELSRLATVVSEFSADLSRASPKKSSKLDVARCDEGAGDQHSEPSTVLVSETAEEDTDAHVLAMKMHEQDLQIMLEAELFDVRCRMSTLQESLDDNVLMRLNEMGQQLTQASGNIDAITTQCQECLTRTEAHGVRLNFLRSGLDNSEGRVRMLADRVERALTADCNASQAVRALAGRLDFQAKALEDLKQDVESQRADAYSSPVPKTSAQHLRCLRQVPTPSREGLGAGGSPNASGGC